MRYLNPIFRKDIIPFTVEGYYIRVPRSKSKAFILLKDSVYRPINSSEILAEPIKKIQEEAIDSIAGIKATPTKFTKKKVIYVVKKGDNLGDIADWFDVPVGDIKSWNKLRKNAVKYGQKLTIWVDGNKIGYYKKVNKMTASQKKKIKKKD
jgi:membrane-bound lytic murein transglycosylase D